MLEVAKVLKLTLFSVRSLPEDPLKHENTHTES